MYVEKDKAGEKEKYREEGGGGGEGRSWREGKRGKKQCSAASAD